MDAHRAGPLVGGLAPRDRDLFHLVQNAAVAVKTSAHGPNLSISSLKQFSTHRASQKEIKTRSDLLGIKRSGRRSRVGGDQCQETAFRPVWTAARVSEVPSWFERSLGRSEQPGAVFLLDSNPAVFRF
jgi:hypothetical protein